MTFFHYFHKETILHKMDCRMKLLCMLLLSISTSFAFALPHYLVPISLMMLAIWVAKLPFCALLKDMRFFGVLILIVFISNAFFISGEPSPNFLIINVSQQGVITGFRFAGRLTLIIMAYTVISGTTSLTSLRNAVEWILRPFSFISEVRVATMISLTFKLIPLIFDNYIEIMDAQKSRCIQLQKKPAIRIKYISFPLLTQTFRRADEIINAMESRNYSEIRTQVELHTKKSDWLFLALCTAVLLFVLLF